MKVVILCKWPDNKLKGGMGVHILNLVKSLSSIDGLDLYVLSFGDESKILYENKAKIVLIKAKKLYYAFPILALNRLVLEMKKIQPDIIHLQGSNISPYLLYTLFLAPYKCRKIITVHGIMKIETKFEKRANILIKFINVFFEKYAFNKIHNIIVCSPAMKTFLNDQTNSEIYIIPNGIDLSVVQKKVKTKSLYHPNIIFIGLLREVKGIDILINAIPIIKKSVPNVYLYIIGSGPLENELRTLAHKLNIEKNIEFLGFITEEEKYSYLKSADVCVFPSIYEPFGIVLLEAMACEKAIVASNVGGIPYIVDNGKTGLLFECGDINELSQRIISLLQDKEMRSNMGKAGKEKVTLFSWDIVARQTYELYSKILK